MEVQGGQFPLSSLHCPLPQHPLPHKEAHLVLSVSGPLRPTNKQDKGRWASLRGDAPTSHPALWWAGQAIAGGGGWASLPYYGISCSAHLCCSRQWWGAWQQLGGWREVRQPANLSTPCTAGCQCRAPRCWLGAWRWWAGLPLSTHYCSPPTPSVTLPATDMNNRSFGGRGDITGPPHTSPPKILHMSLLETSFRLVLPPP